MYSIGTMYSTYNEHRSRALTNIQFIGPMFVKVKNILQINGMKLGNSR